VNSVKNHGVRNEESSW